MMTPAIPDRPDRPDHPAFTSQCAYPHLSLLRPAVAAVVLAALLFRPLNSAVQERVKNGELFFDYMILFYWPATLTTAGAGNTAARGGAARTDRRWRRRQERVKKGKLFLGMYAAAGATGTYSGAGATGTLGAAGAGATGSGVGTPGKV